jgi:rhodanese-related sulfurtransferase
MYTPCFTAVFIAIRLTTSFNGKLIGPSLIMVTHGPNVFSTMTVQIFRISVIAVALIIGQIGGQFAAQAADKRISAIEAYNGVVNGSLTLIDIRSPQEWEKSGIPKGSIPVTMHNPAGKSAFRKAVLAAVKGDRMRPIALICAVGGRSHWAQGYLKKHGFTQVVDVSEGMFGRGKTMPGWLKRDLPVEPCKTCTKLTH